LVVSGEEEGRERRRRDKKDSRRSSREDREEEDRHKKRKKSKHSDRDKGRGWVLSIVIITNQFWVFNTFCSMSASTSLCVIIALSLYVIRLLAKFLIARSLRVHTVMCTELLLGFGFDVCVLVCVAERDSKERHSKEKEKSERKDKDAVSSLDDILCLIGHY